VSLAVFHYGPRAKSFFKELLVLLRNVSVVVREHGEALLDMLLHSIGINRGLKPRFCNFLFLVRFQIHEGEPAGHEHRAASPPVRGSTFEIAEYGLATDAVSYEERTHIDISNNLANPRNPRRNVRLVGSGIAGT